MNDSAHSACGIRLASGRNSDTAKKRRRYDPIKRKMMSSGDDITANNVDRIPRSAVGAHFRIRDYVTSLPGIIRVSLVVRNESSSPSHPLFPHDKRN